MNLSKLIEVAKKVQDYFTKNKRKIAELEKTLATVMIDIELMKKQIEINKTNLEVQSLKLREGLALIREATEVHHDLPYFSERDPHRIVLIGQFKGQDYFRIFAAEDNEFKHVVNVVKEMNQRHKTRTIEGPEPIRMAIKREINEY